ncbi:MAG: hypothetical protein OEY97_06125 [Nitrospirota bacterium]|nr:hypothetical protein [Nitrospirota bacterium]
MTRPVNVLVIGGGTEALEWVPLLFRATEFNVLAVVSTHPADLIRNLDIHGYALTTPGPLMVVHGLDDLGALPAPDVILDTTVNPAVLPRLAAAGLDAVPRLNPAAMRLLMAGAARAGGPPAADADLALRLTKEVGRAYRNGRTLGLILIDLHTDGKEPDPEHTRRAQQSVEEALRLQDVVGHTGDGTLAILLPETGDATHRVARRLTSNLADLKIGVSGEEGQSPKLGWVWFPQEAKTAQAMLDKARARMGDRPPPPH